jgi:hypothetical protein
MRMKMMNHCRDFLMNEIDDCRNFAVFLKFLKVKMKMIVSRNFSLLMTRGMIVLLIIDATILLMIAAFSSLE